MFVKSIMATVLAVAAGGVGLGVSGKFCDDGCGHGGDKAKVTQSASSKTSLVSLKGEGHGGECQGKCDGHGANKAKVTKAASSKTSLISFKGEGQGKCDGHGANKAKPAADKSEAKTKVTQDTPRVAKVN